MPPYKVIAGIFVLVGLAIGYIWISTTEQASIGSPIVEVKIASLTQQAKIGEGSFVANCASCHGINAVGKDGIAPPLIHIIYEPSHHGDQSFYRAAKIGVRAHHWPFGNMPPVDDVSDMQLANIIYYIRELQRTNGIN